MALAASWACCEVAVIFETLPKDFTRIGDRLGTMGTAVGLRHLTRHFTVSNFASYSRCFALGAVL